MRKVKWTEEEFYKLSKLYHNNKTDKEIGEVFNTAAINIYRIRIELGLTDNYKLDWDDEDVRKYIINHFKKAESINQLSNTLKLAHQTILRVLKKYEKEGYINKTEIESFK